MPRLTSSTRSSAKKFVFRPSVTLIRVCVAAVCLIWLLVMTLSMAQAQDGQGQARQVCKADYQKFCTGISPGGGRVRKCLNDNFDALSGPCKQAMTLRPGK